MLGYLFNFLSHNNNRYFFDPEGTGPENYDPNVKGVVMSGTQTGMALGGAFIGIAAPIIVMDGLAVESVVTVGRWMSLAEYNQMVSTGQVVQSWLGGVTSVSFPAAATSYANAAAGSLYVEFDVAANALNAVGNGWAKIYGPASIFAGRLGITAMPAATNIVLIMYLRQTNWVNIQYTEA